MSSDGGEGGGGGGGIPPIKASITPPNCLLAITGANKFARRLRKKSLESKERAVKVSPASSKKRLEIICYCWIKNDNNDLNDLSPAGED